MHMVAVQAWQQGVRWFAVAHMDEAVALRKILPKVRILILGCMCPRHAAEAAHLQLTPIIADRDHALELAKHASSAGVILTGGGSAIDSATDVAQHVMRLPCRTASLMVGELGKQKLRDGSWSVAYGLTVWNLSNRGSDGAGPTEDGSVLEVLRDLFKKVLNFFKRFLP